MSEAKDAAATEHSDGPSLADGCVLGRNDSILRDGDLVYVARP
jgi:hypothetical protein